MKKQKTQSKLIVALTAVVLLLVALSATLTFAYFTASSNATSDSMTFGTLNIDFNNETLGATACEHATGSTSIDTLVPGCEISIGASNNITVTTNIDSLIRATVTFTAWQTHQVVNGNAVAFGENDVYDDSDPENITGIEGVKAYKADGTEAGQGDTVAFRAIKTEINQTSNNPTDFANIIFNTMGDVAGWTYRVDTVGTGNEAVNYGRFYYNNIVGETGTITFADTFTLDAAALGNTWQGAKFKVNVVVEAIQAEHLTNASAEEISIVKDTNGNTIEAAVVKVNNVAVADGDDANNTTIDEKVAAIASATAWGAVSSDGVLA